MRPATLLSGLLFATAGFAWTSAGQTSDPLLDAAELPLEVWRDCQAVAGCDRSLYSRWLGRSSGRDLFLVRMGECSSPYGEVCRLYLIEKVAHATQLLLVLDGAFSVYRSATGGYPAFEVRRALDEIRSSIYRYEWRDGRYVRSAARLVYRIGGEECGTLEQCRAAAERALREGRTGRALEIWQQAVGLSWI